MALRLRYNDRTLVLPAGQLFVGRSPECHIVTTDPQASRRHAVITMGKTGAFVTDLGSKAGVRVNGEVIVGARRLARGDAISLSGLQIAVESVTAEAEEEPADPRMRSTIAPPALGSGVPGLRLNPTPPLGIPRVDASRALDTLDGDDGEDEDDHPLASTQQASVLRGVATAPRAQDVSLTHTQEAPRVTVPDPARQPAAPLIPAQDARPLAPPSSRRGEEVSASRIPRLAPLPSFPREGTLRALAAVSEKAIALGRAEEAERILQRALPEALEGVRRGELDAGTAELAASLAARLAGATGSGRWFDFAVSVYVARGELAPANVVDLLYGAVGKARPVDKAMFREYLAAVRGASGDSPARRFVIQRLEGLQRILDLK
jgi:pSer/pThr/pTyr-binding forkhead associated (FHA) protein